MTTVYHVHKCWTFTAIGFTTRTKNTYATCFDDKQDAIDYCEKESWADFNPMTQDMTTVFYYIMAVDL